MQDKDRLSFGHLMAGMGEIYGPATEAKIQIYWGVLLDFDIEEISKAVAVILRSRPTASFPKPAEIIQAIQGTDENKALVALTEFEEAMRRDGGYRDCPIVDPVMLRVINRMGGWWNCCMDHDWRFRRNEFKKLYESTLKESDFDSILLAENVLRQKRLGK